MPHCATTRLTPRPTLLPTVRRRRCAPAVIVAVLAVAVALLGSGARAQPHDSERLTARAAALPQLRSLLVSLDGELVVEHYARGVRATTLANIKSASKGIVTALVGIAIERGLIPSVDTPVSTWFPELRTASDTRKRTLTLSHLLTMQTGLASTSGANYGPWVRSRDWVRFALTRPMVSDPGTSMEYSTGTSHILSAILTKVSGTSTWAFARDVLARPLGFTLARWPRDPQGIYFGGNDMLLTPRQMVRVGELYLVKGEAGGRQVVPSAWVEASCTPRTRSRYDPDREFGYGWWVQEIGGQRACFAWGYGGQYILVFDALDLVVVATSSPTVSDERHGHRRQLLQLIGEEIVEPLALARGVAAAPAR